MLPQNYESAAPQLNSCGYQSASQPPSHTYETLAVDAPNERVAYARIVEPLLRQNALRLALRHIAQHLQEQQ